MTGDEVERLGLFLSNRNSECAIPPQKKGVMCGFQIRPSLLCHLLRFPKRSRGLLSPHGKMAMLKQMVGSRILRLGNISYIVKIWSLNMHEAEKLDGYG